MNKNHAVILTIAIAGAMAIMGAVHASALPAPPCAPERATVQVDGSFADVLADNSLQFIFVGGKGGVGKTTVSSSLAIQLAIAKARAAGITEEAAARDAAAAAARAADPAARLAAFYTHHGKPKKATKKAVAKTLKKYAGREAALFDSLVAKYGPEPSGDPGAPNAAPSVLLVSTDPAHSLGDAFQLEFSGRPTRVPGLPLGANLHVMEIDPSIVMRKEIRSWAKLARKAGVELAKEISKFQGWLSSVPGIDEATALASVIGHIDSSRYAAVVVDTAPTGHTLKLLALPGVLQVGLEKLEGWQSTLWEYYEMATSLGGLFGGGGQDNKARGARQVKKTVAKKIAKYKGEIEKVAKVLKDERRTTFVPVCIAEHLSASETRRLLKELRTHGVHTSHLAVNMLIPQDLAMDEAEVALALPAADPAADDFALVAARQKLRRSLELIQARAAIQGHYLGGLERYAWGQESDGDGAGTLGEAVAAIVEEEAREAAGADAGGDGNGDSDADADADADGGRCLDVVRLPLRPGEVTGVPGLLEFSELLKVPRFGAGRQRPTLHAKEEL